MRTNLKIVWAAMTVVAAILSWACRVDPAPNGSWWASGGYQAASTTVSACRPLDAPFLVR